MEPLWVYIQWEMDEEEKNREKKGEKKEEKTSLSLERRGHQKSLFHYIQRLDQSSNYAFTVTS